MLSSASSDPSPSEPMDPDRVCAMLDSLGIALCTYDARLRAVRWNRTFVELFPEHAGLIHAGEPYEENLRRFYRVRLDDPDRQPIDQHVAEGVRRHLNQTRPFTFFHHGRWLRVTCQPGADGSRTRAWVPLPTVALVDDAPLPDVAACADPSPGARHASFENVADGVMVLDPRGRIVSVNEEFIRLYGLAAREALVGLEFRDVVAAVWRRADPRVARVHDAEGDRPPAWQFALADHAHFAGAPFELPLPGDRWIRIMAHETLDHMRYSVHVDITAFKRQEHELRAAERLARQSEARFRAAFDHAGIATGLIDASTGFVDVNTALCELLGMAREALLARCMDRMVGEDDATALRRAVADLRTGRAERFEHDMVLRADGPDGARVPVWTRLSCTAVGGEPDAPAALLVVQLQDVGAVRAAEAQRDRLVEHLRYQATHDPLTRLFNRTHFEVQVSEAIEALAAAGDGPGAAPPEAACLCFFDLDGFKAINDTAGHAAGDAALQEIAALFAKEIGRDGLIARVGGDEFAALLRHHDTDRARALAARIVARLREAEFRWEGSARRLGVSIGITALHRPDTLADALRRADAACYAAKRSGSSQVRTAPAPVVPPSPAADA
jgi:diguanylate cyclase (GGDEF)-like protein/PAS domain S-box-containing protein